MRAFRASSLDSAGRLTVKDQRPAGEVGGVIAGKKGNQASGIMLRLTEVARRQPPEEVFRLVRILAVIRQGVSQKSRKEAVDGDSLGSTFHGLRSTSDCESSL